MALGWKLLFLFREGERAKSIRIGQWVGLFVPRLWDADYDENVGIFSGGDMEKLDRITVVPGVMGGRPTIRGMRVTVSMIVGQIAAGRTADELLADFPYLERDDIRQALMFAAERVQEREVELVPA